MRFWLSLYTAITIIGLLLITSSLTRAQEVELGQGLVCDTTAQVERYLAVANGDPNAAIEQVNQEVKDPTACVLRLIAFVRGKQGEVVRNPDGAWKVTEVLVIAVYTPRGWQQIAPAIFYTAIKVAEQGA